MISFYSREMTILTRIFACMLCVAPFVGAQAAGPVATTAGSNLTAFNPSNVNNNQWATLSNGRAGSSSGAKADFGNCNALISRCATPKCANGGCSDMSVASSIVRGCVQSNKTCEQYGEDLVSFMSAQLVASSNAKINAQQAQIAQQQSMESQQQMQQMQQQMYQMQQEMAQQNAAAQQQLQQALAQQQTQMAQQQAAALEQVSAAATAAAQQTEAGISSYQEAAINRGISADVLERQKISGQIITELENAQVSLKGAQTAMNEAFVYAGCDMRGNNCAGPKRVARWREKAIAFIDPYDSVIDSIYDAIIIAQGVVDLSDIYMMLDDSCDTWATYMCDTGNVRYEYNSNGQKGTPRSCSQQSAIDSCITTYLNGRERTDSLWQEANNECLKLNCHPCTRLKLITNKDEVYESWIGADKDTNDNTTVVACASGAITNSALFARRSKAKSGGGLIDIDTLERWIYQKESNNPEKFDDVVVANDTTYYCDANIGGGETELRKKIATRSLSKEKDLCITKVGDITKHINSKDDECEYISPIYGICDTHVYNVGEKQNYSSSQTTERDKMKEIIALKTTVISQQMYKQYEYLNATLRRLKTQLEKSVLMANLEAAGAKSDSDSGGSSSRNDKDNGIYLAGAENCWNASSHENAYNCIQSNANLVKNNINSNKSKACKQLQETVKAAESWITTDDGNTVEIPACKNIKTDCSKQTVTSCANALGVQVANARKRDSKSRNTGLLQYVQP